jgi:hypothetical protein
MPLKKRGFEIGIIAVYAQLINVVRRILVYTQIEVLQLLPLQDDQFRGYEPMQRIHVQVDGWLPNMYCSSQIGLGCPVRIFW